MGPIVMKSGKGMRDMQGKSFLYLPPDSTTLTTDIASHLRTLETKGNLSVMSPRQRNS